MREQYFICDPVVWNSKFHFL